MSDENNFDGPESVMNHFKELGENINLVSPTDFASGCVFMYLSFAEKLTDTFSEEECANIISGASDIFYSKYEEYQYARLSAVIEAMLADTDDAAENNIVRDAAVAYFEKMVADEDTLYN